MSHPPFEFLLGGTFDPIHYGHLAIINRLQTLEPKLPIRIVPCAIPALKEQASATFEQRVDMLNLALAEKKGIAIDCREAKRSGPSYTIDTLRELSEEKPETRFLLVMGADAAGQIDAWHEAEQLPRFCHLVVLNRPHYPLREVEKTVRSLGFMVYRDFEEILQGDKGGLLTIYMTDNELSSTQMRDALDSGKSLSGMTVKPVIDYIHKHRLYTQN